MAQARLFTLYRYKSIYLPTKFSHSSGISLFSCIPQAGAWGQGTAHLPQGAKRGISDHLHLHNFALVTYR